MEVQILLCICTARRKNEIAASGAQKHFVFAAQTYKKPVGIAAAGAFLIESTWNKSRGLTLHQSRDSGVAHEMISAGAKLIKTKGMCVAARVRLRAP